VRVFSKFVVILAQFGKFYWIVTKVLPHFLFIQKLSSNQITTLGTFLFVREMSTFFPSSFALYSIRGPLVLKLGFELSFRGGAQPPVSIYMRPESARLRILVSRVSKSFWASAQE
jgi:hypothetical protein